MDEGRKRWDNWVGFVADSHQGKVVWDDGTTTVYGPKTKENPKFYSDVCLAEDKAAGKLLYTAVAQLIAGQSPYPTPVNAPLSVTNAIKKAVNCYKKKQRHPPWLIWLQGCIQLSNNATGKLFHAPLLAVLQSHDVP